jgi:peptide chain release factor 2
MEIDSNDLKVECYPNVVKGMKVGIPVGVKITHVPTGLSTICEEHRSQHKNRDEALRQLEALLDTTPEQEYNPASKPRSP